MKVAIIGLGVIGAVHAELIVNRGDELTALCDIDPAVLTSAQAKWAPGARLYTDYKEMLVKEELDIVHICTPHYLHTEMIVEALSRNVNTLCEKPHADLSAEGFCHGTGIVFVGTDRSAKGNTHAEGADGSVFTDVGSIDRVAEHMHHTAADGCRAAHKG